ncbi:MAG: glycosyltransferase family 39 protein, partial [Verrucomicrobiota bacterium]
MIGTNEIRVLLLLLGLTVLRLLLGAFTELSPDEAYYLLWAERLDWSYYSKGPGVAVALWITTGLFGETEFGVRCLSPVLGFGTSVLMYLLGKRTVGRDAALWAVVIFNLTPIFNAWSILLTIDPLMMFFWSASLLCSWMALERSWNREWGWWAATGLCLALGFLCKYTIIVVFVTILLHLGLSRRRRVHLKRPGFYLMTGILLLGSLPILIWNAQHGWITF